MRTFKSKEERLVNRTGSKPIVFAKSSITEFTSQGGAQVSSPLGNQFFNLDIPGNPWDGSQDGSYKLIVLQMDLSRYFSANVFQTYDRYRVAECETTFYWKSGVPTGGPILAEMYFCIDKDSRTDETLIQTANRTALQTRTFDVCHTRQVIAWKPFLVEDSDTFDIAGKQVDYTQNRNRWLNTAQVRNHRFGAIRAILQCHDASTYGDNSPAIGVRHRIKIQVSGLKSAQV